MYEAGIVIVDTELNNYYTTAHSLSQFCLQ